MSVLGNIKKGLIFILSAPAGTGKTTLVQKLVHEFPSIVQSISFTTRAPRPGEIDGKDYFFITKDEFQKKIAANEFLEYVELYGDFYGTSKEWVEKHLSHGHHVFLVIDTQGAKKLMPSLEACFIFVMPPSKETLKTRLMGRKTETEEVIEKRLGIAEKEMGEALHYQYQIINDKLEVAYDVLRSIVIAEGHRIDRHH